MRKRFFRNFKVRVPRKLKKAAKYGVIVKLHNRYFWNPCYSAGKHFEKEYIVVGRHNKWKKKVLSILYRENGFYYVKTW